MLSARAAVREASRRAALTVGPESRLHTHDVALARIVDALLVHLESTDSPAVCTHAIDWLGTGFPLWWAPGAPAVACGPCRGATPAGRWVAEQPDGPCFICGRRRSYKLWQAAVPLGPIVVFAGVCRRCRPKRYEPPYAAVDAAARVCAYLEPLLSSSPGPEAA